MFSLKTCSLQHSLSSILMYFKLLVGHDNNMFCKLRPIKRPIKSEIDLIQKSEQRVSLLFMAPFGETQSEKTCFLQKQLGVLLLFFKVTSFCFCPYDVFRSPDLYFSILEICIEFDISMF